MPIGISMYYILVVSAVAGIAIALARNRIASNLKLHLALLFPNTMSLIILLAIMK